MIPNRAANQNRKTAIKPSAEEAKEAVRTLIRWAGDDPAREGLIDTPQRVIEAYEEFYSGYTADPAEILASVKNGIYAANFGGGQVDITSGKYVFQCTEAYKIENGKLGAPLKGAMLIGNGPTDLHRISMIGNDVSLDSGIGTCGKHGQGVPVGVGQPTLRMDRITVGGTGA